MAVVSPVPAISQQLDRIRLHEIGVSAVMSSTGEIMEEQPVAVVVEEKIYVAVCKDMKESKLNLVWALQNSGGKRICLVHVHQPAQMIPISNSLFLSVCFPSFFFSFFFYEVFMGIELLLY